MTLDLFARLPTAPARQSLAPGAEILRGGARAEAPALLAAVAEAVAAAPLRCMQTPGGKVMSVAMTSCGVGWVSDTRGYRYTAHDPNTGAPWPPIAAEILALGHAAARQAGYTAFSPNACLINEYAPGARMTLHQDRDEDDFAAPIVSVSLGLPAVFLFGGARRTDRSLRVQLWHGDVVVWGGPSRLAFHGVAPLAHGDHVLVGRRRINLTLRQVAAAAVR